MIWSSLGFYIGNLLQVIRERKWGEVKGIFRFPSSVTSASFVLRKYYLSMLYHFEQVYYFRKEEPSVSVAGIMTLLQSITCICCFKVFVIKIKTWETSSICSADPTNRNVTDSVAEHANNDNAATNQCSGVLPIF